MNILAISTCTGAGIGVTGAVKGSPLYDAAASPANACLEITRDALAQMYQDGTFYIVPGSCGGTGTATTAEGQANTLDAQCVIPTPTTGALINAGVCTGAAIPAATAAVGPFVSISRSDFGGTEDTAIGYLKGAPAPGPALNSGGKLAYTSGSGIAGSSKNIGSGNLGVLQVTQACSASATGVVGVLGCVGFFDLGFAEGHSAQAAATCPNAAGSRPCNIFIAEVSTGSGVLNGEAAVDLLQESTAAGAASTSSYVAQLGSANPNGDSTANIDTFIKSALKTAATQNPATLQYSQASSLQTFFPDPAASSASNPLDRTFYAVTNGTPNPVEEQYISFLTNYAAETYFTGAGYYSQYDITSA